MGVRPTPCKHCGEQVVWLPNVSGRVFPFWAKDFPLEEVAPKDQYGLKVTDGQAIAIPLDGDRPRHGKCLMSHYCADYRDSKLLVNVTGAVQAMTG